MVTPLPTAIFGKPDGASAYQLIHQDTEFESPALVGAFRRICGSFEWRPIHSGLQHRPCYGILRIGDLLLVSKFRDTGRDATGRPHTLRIECLAAKPNELHAAWSHLNDTDTPAPPIPEEEQLLIIGDPDTFWSSTNA